MPQPTDMPAGGARSSYRTSIVGWMVWITCCAVALTAHRALLSSHSADLNPLRLFLWCVYTGTCWVVLLQLVWLPLRSGLETWDPGEWVLATLGLIIVGEMLRGFALDLTSPLAVSASIHCLAWTVPSCSKRLPVRWRLFFCVITLLYAVVIFAYLAGLVFTTDSDLSWRATSIYGVLPDVIPWLIVGLLVPVTLMDGVNRDRFSWRHWVGIVWLVIGELGLLL